MYSISCQNSRSKNCYMMFQNKLLFNLVKDFSNELRVLGGVSLSKLILIEKDFLPRGYPKKVLDTLSKFDLKKGYIVFQHKLLFNLVKDSFKWTEGLVRSFTVRVQSDRERISDLGGKQKKYSIRCQSSRSRNGYLVFQHKLLFNLVKDSFNWTEGLVRSFTVRVQSDREKIFDPGSIRKKYSTRCQTSR